MTLEPKVSGGARLRTLDGLQLVGTVATCAPAPDRGVVLVHGGGVTREEGGFFTRLADGLAAGRVASLRYDLRGHGASEGSPGESSLAAHLNDIRVAVDSVRAMFGLDQVDLLGTSFGGGLSAYYAAQRPAGLRRLVLLNPQLDYKKRYVDTKPHWTGDFLDEDAARQLAEHGYLHHSPTVRHSRAFLNEVFWINPIAVVSTITIPTLIVHGTRDTFVPIEMSRSAAALLTCDHRLVEIPGAQHGFAVHDDPEYVDPQSQAWQRQVIELVLDWLTATS